MIPYLLIIYAVISVFYFKYIFEIHVNIIDELNKEYKDQGITFDIEYVRTIIRALFWIIDILYFIIQYIISEMKGA